MDTLTPGTRAYTITEFCRAHGIGRTKVYAEIAARRLRAIKVGRRTLISRDDAERWLSSLPETKAAKVNGSTAIDCLDGDSQV